ncbi:MAG: replicative DNA helicase [Spirochaetes bacterium]|nr:replicative DNA helicase [Spirochaetota bacterium]MBN2772491.1 replicative DNA helicase [Spirochaetota bacterium]
MQQVPPHDLEAEASCIAAITISRDALVKVLDLLSPDDFYLERHKIIFEAVTDLDRSNSPVDLLTVKQRLQDTSLFDRAGGDAYLAELYQTVSTSANAEYYAKRIKELSLRRMLITVSRDVAVRCHDMTIDTPTMLDEAERDIFRVTERRITSDIETIDEIVRQTLDQINLLHQNKRAVTGISCGFTDIDKMLTGFHESELIILAARPSMGKTALALNFMNHIVLEQKKPVFFFSLEMPSTHLLQRLICIEGLIDAQRLRTGHLNNDEMRTINQVAEKYRNAPILIDDTPGVTIADIRAKARRATQKQPLGMIIIDYIQLITSTSRVDRQQQVAEISRGLKLLARELNCPIIALSQLSRAVESRTDQKPILSDLRESGSIEQDADVVMFIFREDRVKRDSERTGRADIIVAKQRNGPIGDVELLFWDKFTKFNDVDIVHTYPD